MSETLLLKRASTDDVDAIRALVRETYGKWVPVIGREPLPMQADYAEAVKNHQIDVLFWGDTLAGLIEMIPKDDHLLIENIAIAPACQGKGLGRKLLNHAEQVAQSLGHSEIRLYTNKLFAENVEIYLKTGYKIDREETWTGGIIVHMRKSLRAA
ncbi:GNAT family N-acetyltransferase [Thalassospira sp.]|uniref:GNAT family N-acetyltransferase n=1 Tax=Thalassospira sp. TaxID=1912094 RepID=UPI002733F484|nr:GNAT family N-acetyltransferase [Thalassospira sp.]MDP2697568.1 GNAT family N-acetyltransferase [Thalassospira sp.]